MAKQKNRRSYSKFFFNIVLPTVLTMSLFAISIFYIIIPQFEDNILDRKREMIRELTNSAWSILYKYEKEERDSILSREEAQKMAISDISNLRYGEENKDYFWITDMQPKMIMHPFRKELEGDDLSNFEDSKGKKLFVEFVEVVKDNDDGFVDYTWQWKDDSTRIVPKLSYVKKFEAWGWIIGTGIYIEDVKVEIAEIEKKLVRISSYIIGSIALLLMIIAFQSFKIEKERRNAENALIQSKEKYKKLVEAATEGIIMILKGSIVYSNRIIQKILGYSEEELYKIQILSLISSQDNDDINFSKLLSNEELSINKTSVYESSLISKDGNLINMQIDVSKTNIGSEEGYILKIKEISETSQEFIDNKQQFKSLTNNLKIGVYRSTLGRNSRFIEANPATLDILGYESETELFEKSIAHLFYDKIDRKDFFYDLVKSRSVKKRVIKLIKNDGVIKTIAVSAVIVKDEYGEDRYCDGVIEDITEQKINEEKREDLIVELQTSLLFLDQALKHSTKKILTCGLNTSIKEAAKLMSKHKRNAIFIKTETNEVIGIITNNDLNNRVLSVDYDINAAVTSIMSAPIIAIDESALMYEALLLMQEKDIRQLAIKDSYGNISTLINNDELLQSQSYSSSIMIHEIERAEDLENVISAHKKLPPFIKALINSGANVQNITRIITKITDSITNKLIEFAIKKLGEPPVRFAFVVMGSLGREEQTLVTDQDNAIIFEDVEAEKLEKVREYFLKFAEIICVNLDKSGYELCKGNNMAMNPKWCQPLSQWKKYFSTWIFTPEPQNLLEINIFFDFRCAYGYSQLTEDLRSFINERVNKNDKFLFNLSQNALLYKAPLNFFGNIQTKSTDEYSESLDIKETIIPIVMYARIYALKHNVNETNTIGRIEDLQEKNIISKEQKKEFLTAYNYLMLIRFKHHIQLLTINKKPNNFINPQKLTDIDRSMLKKIFKTISDFQKRLNSDFSIGYDKIKR